MPMFMRKFTRNVNNLLSIYGKNWNSDKQEGRPILLSSGAGGRKFNSCHPDQILQGVTAFAVAPFSFVP